LAPRAALAAAARNSGWPLTAVAETTLPDSSINTWTLTEPLALTALAAGGYGGFGKLMALAFSMPPEIVFGGAGDLSGFANGGSRLLFLLAGVGPRSGVGLGVGFCVFDDGESAGGGAGVILLPTEEFDLLAFPIEIALTFWLPLTLFDMTTFLPVEA
jgi:hypothetical protein